MEFLADYGLFLLKAITVVIALLITIGGIVALSSRHKKIEHEGHIEVKSLNDKYEDMEDQITSVVLDHDSQKKIHKERQKQEKADAKAKKKDEELPRKKRVYVLRFDGDTQASEVEMLREEISAVLTVAESQDEVVVCVESPGGLVHSYGLAASQLQRITNAKLHLTVAVDAVAASGGYMMACVADKIIAAPFAVIGSIGVMAQVPNVHRLLKKYDVDVELHTAGEFKRTLTVFGENTEKGRQKFLEELEDTHVLFKEFVQQRRPLLNVAEVATGEIWYGVRAYDKKLIDMISTSDEYLMSQRKDADIFSVRFQAKKTLQERLGLAMQSAFDGVVLQWMNRLQQRWF